MASRFRPDRFHELPIVGILRGFDPRQTAALLAAARAGGLSTVEITMDTPGAPDLIRRAVADHGDTLNLGAGTVTSIDRLEAALAAGAMFVVTPTFDPVVVARCRALGVPVFPGALSPTEIEQAWSAGATLVKVFPADGLGPRHLRALKASLPHIRLLPTGGVDLASLAEYARAGADGFGIGSPLFRRDRVDAEDWPWIETRCRAFRTALLALRAPP
jgi:2-dehydro-3-deoxyphosphogluconate aldolase/(4S)-4-hydroxy-2-oxoglutarate aldolase